MAFNNGEGNWYGSTLSPARLHAIVNAPLLGPQQPLSRAKQVQILAACYRLNGYIKLGEWRVASTRQLAAIVEQKGGVVNGDESLVKEALAYLDV